MSRRSKSDLVQTEMFSSEMVTTDPREQLLAQIQTVESVLLDLHNALRAYDKLSDSVPWVVKMSNPIPVYRSFELSFKL